MDSSKDFAHKLGVRTERLYSAAIDVKQAFTLGLHFTSYPDYMREHLYYLYDWDANLILPESKAPSWHMPCLGLKFQFISDTADAWHQCYRDLRLKGWQRKAVYRDGGRLQYLFELLDKFKPEGFQQTWLLLDISISACKKVQVGTKTVEEPIYETQCEDLKELETEEEAAGNGFVPAVHLTPPEVLSQPTFEDDIPF